MHTYADRIPDGNIRAYTPSQNRSKTERNFQFEDNRTEFIAQRKHAEAAKKQALQQKESLPHFAQSMSNETMMQRSCMPPPLQLKSNSQDVIQGVLIYQNKKYNSIEDLEKRLGFSLKNKLGSSKSKPSERARISQERWNTLNKIAQDPDEEYELPNMLKVGAESMNKLKAGIASYIHNKNRLALKSEKQSPSGNSTIGDTSSFRGEVSEMVRFIKERNMKKKHSVFPIENIESTAHEASKDSQGEGFTEELKLVCEILKARPNVQVQMGVVAPALYNLYLGYEPPDSTTQIRGRVGGDITIWEPQEARNNKPKHTFIQAKACVATSMKKNVEGAANQLASLTASGDPKNKAAQREFTMTGPSYEGVIYIVSADGKRPSSKTLETYASNAFNKHPEFVHKVIFKFWNYSGKDEYLIYTSVNRKGSEQSTNPLTQDVSGLPPISFDDASSTTTQNSHDENENNNNIREVNESEIYKELNKILGRHHIGKKSDIGKQIKSQIMNLLRSNKIKGITKVRNRDTFSMNYELDLAKALNERFQKSKETIQLPVNRQLSKKKPTNKITTKAKEQNLKKKKELENKGLKQTNSSLIVPLFLLVIVSAALYTIFSYSSSSLDDFTFGGQDT